MLYFALKYKYATDANNATDQSSNSINVPLPFYVIKDKITGIGKEHNTFSINTPAEE